MQKCYLFQNGNITKISQSQLDNYSHTNLYAIDYINGVINAPCDVKVVANGHFGGGRQVYFESTEKVLLANGTTNHICFYVEHLNADIKVGTKFKQNQKIASEGNYGLGSGSHAHIIIGNGKVNVNNLEFTQCGYNSKTGYYSYKPNAFDQADATKILLIKKGCKVEYYFDTPKMNFKKEEDMGDGKIEYCVFSLKTQYNEVVYFYTQSTQYGSILKNNADTTHSKINNKLIKFDNDNVYYYPDLFKNYHVLDIINTTYLYKDVNLTQKIMKNGTHKSIPKGQIICAKFVKNIKK